MLLRIKKIFIILFFAADTFSFTQRLPIGGKSVSVHDVNMPAYTQMPRIRGMQDIIDFIPGVTQIAPLVKTSCAQAKSGLTKIYALTPAERTFANTIEALNYIVALFNAHRMRVWLLDYLTRDIAVHRMCRQAMRQLHDFEIDNFVQNPKLYQACAQYSQLQQGEDHNGQLQANEDLTPEQEYTITKLMREFRMQGLSANVAVQDELKKLKKQLKRLLSRFTRNITRDIPQLSFSASELIGLPVDYISKLPLKQGSESIVSNTRGASYLQNNIRNDGASQHLLSLDANTYRFALTYCKRESTRKIIWQRMVNRAYPKNKIILDNIIATRDKIARLSGFTSYAQLDLYNQMGKTPQRVNQFLDTLKIPVAQKVSGELALLQKVMPLPLAPWDLNRAENMYNKKYLGIPEDAFTAYFPLDQTFQNLCAQFQQLFGTRIVPVKLHKAPLGHLRLFAAYRDKRLLGHILLDLFAHEKKYFYARKVTLVPTFQYTKSQHSTLQHKTEGQFPTADIQTPEYYPALILVQLNLPKLPRSGAKLQNILLRPHELTRIAHEWGHALQALVGCTELPLNSGTAVPRDIAEMMPKLCEKIVWHPEILQKISGHFKTKKQLPKKLLQKIISIYRNNSGQLLQKQIYDASLALAFYGPGTHKNLDALSRQLYQSIISYTEFNPAFHGYASFQHIGVYGAKYYCYLWSRSLAQEIFEKFKSAQFSRAIGEKFITDVLSRGGGADPIALLTKFLGHQPRLTGPKDHMRVIYP